MKLLFLRGRVPQDRDPSQIMFKTIDDCDDMWTQLAFSLSNKDKGAVWYWGGSRRVNYTNNFSDIWSPNYRELPFEPDVIFARGGFPEYDEVLKRTKKAFKIYYGAGRRFLPDSSFKDFNLILVDTPKQRKIAKSKFPKSDIQLFIKPAADNVFYPRKAEKIYDIIFVGNEHPKGIKGQDFALPRLAKYKTVHVGLCKKLKKRFPAVEFTGWIPRKDIPNLYAQSKIAVVAADQYDSCPRVIPEALACNCPILCLNSVKFWHDKYITPQTGKLCSRDEFEKEVDAMVSSFAEYNVYEYYSKHLSLRVAAEHIKSFIGTK